MIALHNFSDLDLKSNFLFFDCNLKSFDSNSSFVIGKEQQKNSLNNSRSSLYII